jgi:hypothetical protein
MVKVTQQLTLPLPAISREFHVVVLGAGSSTVLLFFSLSLSLSPLHRNPLTFDFTQVVLVRAVSPVRAQNSPPFYTLKRLRLRRSQNPRRLQLLQLLTPLIYDSSVRTQRMDREL